mgnify:CR=1 FL=1
MFTAILWDYDGTLANTPVKNIAVTRAVLGRLDPALLDPLPEALSSLAAYQAANYRWRNWRELYQHALRVPADRLDEAGALWGPCQLADRTLPPLFGGLLEVLPRLAALAPMGICSQNDSGNIRAALAAHGATMVIFLSAGMLEALSEELQKGAYTADTPAALVYKATWPEEKIFRCTVGTLHETVTGNGLTKTSLIVVGNCLGDNYLRSLLYHPDFTTEFRKGAQ